MHDIGIIGGGAAGLAAAVIVKWQDPSLDVVIIEKNREPGRKILATGNGRCNLSNENAKGYEDVIRFFSELGVVVRKDSAGRFYPYSEDAKAVAEALIEEASASGVRFVLGREVVSVRREEGAFCVLTREAPGKEKNKGKSARPDKKKGSARSEEGASGSFSENAAEELSFRKLLIAAGGKAAPAYGTTGDGTRLAASLGLRVSRLAPALTGIETEEDLRELAGVRQKGTVSLYRRGVLTAFSEGEIQFNDYGVSGICIMDITRYFDFEDGVRPEEGFRDYELSLDLLPEMSIDMEELLRRKGLPGSGMLRSLVKPGLSEYITKHADSLQDICFMLKSFPLTPKKLRGWQYAQVTKGGVLLSEVDEESFESKRIPGLYLAGEVLNYDGPCGGYNLNFAWRSGIAAGLALAAACGKSE